MRRMFIFLVILTLFPLAALCETGAERLQTLDILSQRDERLTKDEYFYRGMTFSIAGCPPASPTPCWACWAPRRPTPPPCCRR